MKTLKKEYWILSPDFFVLQCSKKLINDLVSHVKEHKLNYFGFLIRGQYREIRFNKSIIKKMLEVNENIIEIHFLINKNKIIDIFEVYSKKEVILMPQVSKKKKVKTKKKK